MQCFTCFSNYLSKNRYFLFKKWSKKWSKLRKHCRFTYGCWNLLKHPVFFWRKPDFLENSLGFSRDGGSMENPGGPECKRDASNANRSCLQCRLVLFLGTLQDSPAYTWIYAYGATWSKKHRDFEQCSNIYVNYAQVRNFDHFWPFLCSRTTYF